MSEETGVKRVLRIPAQISGIICRHSVFVFLNGNLERLSNELLVTADTFVWPEWMSGQVARGKVSLIVSVVQQEFVVMLTLPFACNGTDVDAGCQGVVRLLASKRKLC